MYLSIHLSFYLSICSSTSTKYYTCHEICTSRCTKSCACHQICTPRPTKSCTCHQLYTSTSKVPAPDTKSAFQGHKVLHLPRNLHFKVHKVLRLPRNLHSKAHKVLHLPRNLHFKVHKKPREVEQPYRASHMYHYRVLYGLSTSLGSPAPATKSALQGP